MCKAKKKERNIYKLKGVDGYSKKRFIIYSQPLQFVHVKIGNHWNCA